MKTHAQNRKQKYAGANLRPCSRFSQPPAFAALIAMIAALAAAVGLSSCAGYTTSAPSKTTAATSTSTSAPGILSASTSSVDFGTVPVGSSATQTVTLTDTGTGSLTISGLSVSGTGFSVVGGSSSMTIAAGQSVSVQLEFAPQSVGSLSGAVTVASDAASAVAPNNASSGVRANASPASSNFEISLHGNATQAAISMSPSSLSFSNVTVGQSSTQSVALTNNGTAPLQIKSATVTGAGFSITGMVLPLTIPAGQGTSFTVQFGPTSAGTASGSLAFSDNALASPQAFPVTGYAVAANGTLFANPANYNFNGVAVGTTGTETITLTNSGSSTVTISQASASGTGFSVSGLAAGQTIAAGAQASFTATFAPTAAGNASGAITVSTNASNPTLSIALSGTGTQGGLSANPASINFGGVLVGSSGTVNVTLTNSGTANVSVSAATASGTGFSVSGFTAGTLNPGATTSFTVKFAPTAAGSSSGSVSVASNAPSSPLSISLSGSGTSTQPQLSINPSSITFDSVNVGSNASQTVTLTNNGTGALTITAATISGSGYTMTAAPTTISAGSSGSLSVTFAPTAEGSAAGSISIASNAPGSPAAIALSGTGMESLGSASPASIAFGSVVVGNSNSDVVTLRNSGNTTLSFSQVSVSGSGFSISGLSTSSTIAAGGSLNFTALFTPTSAASSNGSITLATNGSPAQISIGLTGSGTAATQSLSLSSSSLNFGNVQVGSNNSLTTKVTNSGNANVSISGVNVTGTGYTTSGLTSGMTLTPNQSVTLTISFAPTALGNDPATVTIASNATGSPTTISLAGESHTVLLTWTASTSSGVTGYYVYRGTQSGQYTKIDPSAPASSTQFTDNTVAAGTTYYYVVTALNSSGESSYSSPATVSVP
jgi:hypothetical protein